MLVPSTELIEKTNAPRFAETRLQRECALGQHVQYARLEQRVREREEAEESLGHAAADDGGVPTMLITARKGFLRNEPKSAGACHPEGSSCYELPNKANSRR